MADGPSSDNTILFNGGHELTRDDDDVVVSSVTSDEESILFPPFTRSPSTIGYPPFTDCAVEVDSSTQPPTTAARTATTTDTASKTVSKSETSPDVPPSPPPFCAGDHIYQWCTIAGIPAFHHHAIVMQVYWDECDDVWMLHVSDFSNVSLRDRAAGAAAGGNRTSKVSSNLSSDPLKSSLLSNPFSFQQTTPGGWRSYASPASDWKKVVYNATLWEKIKNPSPGTSTRADCDPPGVVLVRVRFLQEHSATLLSMPYHWAYNNCEAAAVWCKTGSFCTLQALSLLASTAAGQAKSTAVLAGTAAATQVSVTTPAAGLWGYIGFTTTTQVPLLVSQPYLIGVLAAYGLLTVGVPAVMMFKAKSEWKQTTLRLNNAFWGSTALEHPEVFVEFINCYYKKQTHRG